MASTSDNSNPGDLGMRRLETVMASLETADFERFEPPAGLWDRIAASISSPPAPSMVVEYWIDAADVVVGTGDGWVEFAEENDAPELASLSSGRTLWSYFGGDEASELWRAVVARVRSEQAEATVPLRCDAPDVRRWFEITITPGADGTVHFRSALVAEEPRTSVTLLSVSTPRDATPPIPVCSWCGNAHDGSVWMRIEELVRHRRLLEETVLPAIEHGICGTCREAMSAEMLVPAGRRGESPSD